MKKRMRGTRLYSASSGNTINILMVNMIQYEEYNKLNDSVVIMLVRQCLNSKDNDLIVRIMVIL